MNKLFKSKYFPFVILFSIMFLCHILFKINWGDDVWFENALNDGLINYIVTRYDNWSSRIIIEIVMIIMLKLPKIFWCLFDSALITLIAYSISKIFSIKNNWISVLLVCLYPFHEASSAGWYATTLNYIWPLAIGLFSLIPIKNAVDNKKEKKYMYPLYIISTLFACNQEQMCAIIFCFYLILIIYLYKKEKLTKFIVVQFILSLISLLFILSCPGNEVRNISEITLWYPSYKYFGLFGKLFLGIVTTFIYSVYNLNIVIFFLAILIPYVLRKNKNIMTKIISYIPLSIFIAFNLFTSVFSNIFPSIGKLIEVSKMYASSPNGISVSISSIFILFVSIGFFASFFYSLYKLFDKDKKYLICLIYLAGLASRIIMGFSPTVYASGMRTFLFLDFAVIIIMANVLNEKVKINKNCYVYLSIIAILQIINTLGFSI